MQAMLLAFGCAASCADVGAGTDKRGATHDSRSVRPDLGSEPAGRGHDAAGVAQAPFPDAAVIPDAAVKPDAAVTLDATVVSDIVDAGCANAIVSDAARTTCSERADSPAVQPPLSLRAGTGGALFRNLYRDFLTEAADLVPSKANSITKARDEVARSAELWTSVACLLDHCAADGRARHLVEAALLCQPIAEHEVSAMQSLSQL
jgi:hypothetical protein